MFLNRCLAIPFRLGVGYDETKTMMKSSGIIYFVISLCICAFVGLLPNNRASLAHRPQLVPPSLSQTRCFLRKAII